MDPRIEAIECKLMLAEDQIESLNLTVYRQQQAIELLQRRIDELKELVHSRRGEVPRRPEDEIPPHY